MFKYRNALVPLFMLFLFGLSLLTGSAHATTRPQSVNNSTLRPFILTSPEFRDGGFLSTRNEYQGLGCNGGNTAPVLHWANPPQAKSYALLLNDWDAAVAEGFHHWIVYNIPASVRTIHENAPYTEGTTSLGTHAYFGPCPPATGQVHHYVFTLYALDVAQIKTAGLTYDGLLQAINGHVVGAVSLVGTFRRLPPA